MSDNVKVAVRVRPFNSREKTRNANLIIEMSGKTTEIRDLENPKSEPKRFNFDYSYWSHDKFTEAGNGYLDPATSKYADQKVVFSDLGQGILDNAWKGYNCSLFAYGQTGSGKSYSMVGYGVNKGIVPMVCEALFKDIEVKRAHGNKAEEYQVSFSMLEIYNEQVRDLLNPASLKVKGGLKVRQHSNKGFYVEQLKTAPVNSYDEIDQKINEGTKNRTVASTNMNATSSRAHTIVAINFTQKTPNAAGQNMTKSSVINLVDLAGSERAESTGAMGDRLKEGASINQSLSTLGNCIKALADLSQGKKGTIVPFRDAVLTKLLKNALGGNSKTVMIAALSPADINFEETLSTLRFADRAKAIKTQAIVNESPTDKLIRELREENQKLLEMMRTGGVGGPITGGASDGLPEDAADRRREMEELVRQNQEEMQQMEQSWQQRMQEREQEFKSAVAADKQNKEQQKTVPHFWNLNEDPALTGLIIHFVHKGKSNIGNNKAAPAPEMLLNGLGIQPAHAVVSNEKNKLMLLPSAGGKIVLNGNEIKEKKELHHHDRILFGSSNLFVLHHPQDLTKQEKAKALVATPSFDTAQEEIAKNSGLSRLTGSGDAKTSEDLLLQEDLVQMFPMVNEVNAISEELDKKCKFELVLLSPQARGKKDGMTEICVRLHNLANNTEFLWDRNKFVNRKYLIQEMYQNYIEGDADWDVPNERCPFWDDPTTEVLVGTVHVYLQSLSYMVDLDENLQITNYKGVEQGYLEVAIFPCTKTGKELTEEYIDDPSELIGKALHFKLKIPQARGIPKRYANTFCTYRLYLDDKPAKTAQLSGINPDYKFEKQYDFKAITQQFLDYLQEEALIVEVWGRQMEQTSSDQGDLTTRELITREKSVRDLHATMDGPIDDDSQGDKQNKTSVEMTTYKRRMERSEQKLKLIIDMVDSAKKNSQTEIEVMKLDHVLHHGVRLKSAARVIQSFSPKSQMSKCDDGGSKTCIVQ